MKKEKINWKNRELKFKKLVKITKNKNKSYDCVIPVSGGKDSTWQVLTAIRYGLKPLCVTWKTPGRNKIGYQNLKNLISLGVDHIDFSINLKVEKYFTLKAFERFGNPLIPMHMAIHAIPLRLATKMKIPLVLWGENSAIEYGGNKKSLKGDKKTYQMDFRNSDEAIREVALDIKEGADMIMVKPGLPYLDIIKLVKENFRIPVIAYQVSGEYSLLSNGINKGLVNNEIILENLIYFK